MSDADAYIANEKGERVKDVTFTPVTGKDNQFTVALTDLAKASYKKGVAYVVMTAMAMTSMPVAAFADEPAAVESTVVEEKTTEEETIEEEKTEIVSNEDMASMLKIEPLEAKAAKEIDSVDALKTAIDKASDDDVITITKSLEINETINVDKAVTITASAGVEIKVGSADTTFVLSNSAVLDGLVIVNTDATETTNANIVVLGSDTIVRNCEFRGTYTDRSNQVLRAMATVAGAEDFTIEKNKVYNLRQPAYVEGNGTIADNYVEGTRGWVVCANYAPTFENNTFDSNAVDIAIIANGATEDDAALTEAISEISKNNSGAYVENQVNKASAIEGKYYVDETQSNGNATLAGAIKNADTTAAEIVLKNNVTGEFTIEKDQNITLDLNGCTITNTNKEDTITNKGTLKITDSSDDKTGTIDNITHGTAAVWNDGTAVLEAGTYIRSKESGKTPGESGSNSFYNIVNHGNMTIEPDVTVKQEGSFSSMVENGWQNGKQNSNGKPSVMIINGGKFIGGLNTIKNDDYGDLTINGGSFENLTQAAVLNWNITEINGGKYSVNEESISAIILNGCAVNATDMDKGQLTINGGEFNTDNIDVPFLQTMYTAPTYSSGTVEITGGTINGDIVLTDVDGEATLKLSKGAVLNGDVVNSGMADVELSGATVTGNVSNSGSGSVLVSSGSEVRGKVDNTSSTGGTMAVVESSVGQYGKTGITFIDSTTTAGDEIPNTEGVTDAVAMIGTKTYTSIEDAIKDAKSGDTIKLMKDITVSNDQNTANTNWNSAVITIPNGVTLDGNYKKIIAGDTWCASTEGTNKDKPANHIVGIVQGTTATIKNVTIVGNANTKHGINAFGSNGDSNLTVSNVTIQNCGTAGIVINGAKVTATDVKTSGNTWGSINVDDGAGSALDLNGGSFSEDVQIWTEYTSDNIGDNVTVDGTNLEPVNAVVGEGATTEYTYFTSDYTKLPVSFVYNETTKTVYTSLKEALADAKDGDTIHVDKDVELTSDATVADGVTLVVEPGVTLTVADGSAITNNGTIENKGTIDGDVTTGAGGEVTEYYKITFTSNKTIEKVTVKQGDKTIEPDSKDGVVYTLANGKYDYELTSSKGTKTGTFTVSGADDEVYVRFSSGSGTPSYDGGGSSSSSTANDVDVENSKNGSVSVDKEDAKKGDKVTITAKPDEGYVVDEVIVKDKDGEEITVKEADDNEYTFTMPEGDVTISVTFKEEKAEEETENTEEDIHFVDVLDSDWFYDSVKYVVNNGIMSGVSDSFFAPNAKLTRGMLVQMLYNMEDRPETTAANPFTDVAAGQWYADAIIWANDLGISSGMGDNMFAPEAEITREQMVVMLYNYAQYKGYDVTKTAELTNFTDNAKVSPWAVDAVKWAVAEGFIRGMGDGTIAPQSTATRAEIASLVMRFVEAY